ncbi:hypothetical protein RN001_008543 [Aquatica leii]|uniref:Uncharacterized protein n=1 Tax=Aquatica leii TaxID=1421715 RepID=A0AAN7SGV7_9COLE|nr:hypothetical protein RN001_008543 [Aquatica leii]
MGQPKTEELPNSLLSIPYRIKLLLCNNETPEDKRGKNVESNLMGEQYREEIREHISCFPIKTSHYSNKDYKYLDARLNVKIMYSLFKEKYTNSPVKYSYYIKFFKQNFELHFGRPQVDVCNTCEDLSLKIKNPKLNAQAKRVAVAEKIVHQRRAKKFYSTLKTTTEECQQREDLAAFCFDFMQNLQLPEFPTQDKFYLSQLTVSLYKKLENPEQTVNKQETTTKVIKPPPLFIVGVKFTQPLVDLLKQVAPNQYIQKCLNNDEVKIQANTKEAYQAIIKALMEKKLDFTFTNLGKINCFEFFCGTCIHSLT